MQQVAASLQTELKSFTYYLWIVPLPTLCCYYSFFPLQLGVSADIELFLIAVIDSLQTSCVHACVYLQTHSLQFIEQPHVQPYSRPRKNCNAPFKCPQHFASPHPAAKFTRWLPFGACQSPANSNYSFGTVRKKPRFADDFLVQIFHSPILLFNHF